MKDWSDDFVRYVVVSLATWAYAQCFSIMRKLNVDETCREMITAYPWNFSVKFLFSRIVKFPGLATLRVNQRRCTSKHHVIRCVLSSRQPSIMSTVIMATLPCDVHHMIEEQFSNFVSNHVEIIPNNLIESSMKIRFWSVVKTRRDGGINIDSVTKAIRDAKRISIYASPTRSPQFDDRTATVVESSPPSIIRRTPPSDSPRIVARCLQPRIYLKRLSPRTLARYSRSRVLLKRLTVAAAAAAAPTLRR